MTIKVRVTGAEDYGNHLSVLVAGPPGKGKTRFSVTADNPLLLNAEAGTRSIAGLSIPSVEVESSDTLLAMRHLLSQGPEAAEEALGHPVGTVIIDTIDEVQRIIIGERLRHLNQEILGPGDWSWLGDQMNAIVRGFRSLPYHVIFCAHVKDVTDGETGAVSYKLDMSGAIAHQLPAAVDLSLLLTDRVVSVIDDDGKSSEARKSFLYSEPMDRYDWLKDRSGTLESPIELNFEDDFPSIVDRVNSKEFEAHDSVEIEVDGFEEEPPPAPAAPAKKSASDAKAATEAADALVAEAEEKAKAKKAEPGDVVKRSQLTEPSNGAEASIDLSDYEPGDVVTLDGDVPLGYKLGNSERVMQVKGLRVVYELANGEKILSMNELQRGVVPKPNPKVDSGIFCQETGDEITADESNLSRIRFRKIYSGPIFDEEVKKLKR